MTTSLIYFELVRVVCQLKIKDERKLNCVKAIFILKGTLTWAQPIWCKSSTWLSLILSGTSYTNQVLYRFEQVPYLLCWKLGRILSLQTRGVFERLWNDQRYAKLWCFWTPLTRVKTGVKVIEMFDLAFDSEPLENLTHLQTSWNVCRSWIYRLGTYPA